MKSTLTTFAALAALALPAGLPTMVHAQAPEAGRSDSRAADQDRRGGGRGEGATRRGGGERSQGVERRAGEGRARGEGPRAQARDERGGGRDRGGRDGTAGWTRPDRPTSPIGSPPAQTVPQAEAGRGGRGGRDRGDQARPPRGTEPLGGQDRGDRDRGGRDRDRGNDGRWNSGGNAQDCNRGPDRDRNEGRWNSGNGAQDWNRGRNGSDRHWNNDRNGRRDYGGFNNRWNQNDWRRSFNRSRSHDWWRNDRNFRGYSGVRVGFYFAPNHGYYSVPRSYFGQRYGVGGYLPQIFWRYQLNDYRTYGLGYPPAGTQWVLVDTTIYLIDSYDGYIVDAIYDAWRW